MTDKEKYINSLTESLTYSVTKFDTQSLTISGAALAFSLTFIKEIVPFKEAIYIPIFYISLVSFLITIFLGFFGHYLSMKKISDAIKLANQEKYKEINEKKDYISLINAFLISSITSGIIFLIIYCVINIENQRKLTNFKKSNIHNEIISKEKNNTISLKEYNNIKCTETKNK